MRNLCRAAVLPEWNRRFTLSQWFPRPRPCSPTKAARAGFSFCLASCRNGASRNALRLAEQTRSCDYDPCDEGGEAGEQQQIMQDDGPSQRRLAHRCAPCLRKVSLRLTSKGKKALARDPFEVLVRAVDSLDANERTAMHHTLYKVLTTVAASGARRCFGVCQDCAYLGGAMGRNPTSASSSALECLLFGVPIQSEDAGLLCVHFRPTSENRDSGHRE